MTRKTRIAALLWILALAVALWCIPARAQDKGSITLALTKSSGLYLADVSVNGEKHKFLIDTGSNWTIISPKIAGDIGSGSKNIAGIQGSVSAGQTKVLLSLQDKVFRATVLVSKTPESLPIDGILGMDVLGQFESVTLDLKNKTLTLR